MRRSSITRFEHRWLNSGANVDVAGSRLEIPSLYLRATYSPISPRFFIRPGDRIALAGIGFNFRSKELTEEVTVTLETTLTVDGQRVSFPLSVQLIPQGNLVLITMGGEVSFTVESRLFKLRIEQWRVGVPNVTFTPGPQLVVPDIATISIQGVVLETPQEETVPPPSPPTAGGTTAEPVYTTSPGQVLNNSECAPPSIITPPTLLATTSSDPPTTTTCRILPPPTTPPVQPPPILPPVVPPGPTECEKEVRVNYRYAYGCFAPATINVDDSECLMTVEFTFYICTPDQGGGTPCCVFVGCGGEWIGHPLGGDSGAVHSRLSIGDTLIAAGQNILNAAGLSSALLVPDAPQPCSTTKYWLMSDLDLDLPDCAEKVGSYDSGSGIYNVYATCGASAVGELIENHYAQGGGESLEYGDGEFYYEPFTETGSIDCENRTFNPNPPGEPITEPTSPISGLTCEEDRCEWRYNSVDNRWEEYNPGCRVIEGCNCPSPPPPDPSIDEDTVITFDCYKDGSTQPPPGNPCDGIAPPSSAPGGDGETEIRCSCPTEPPPTTQPPTQPPTTSTQPPITTTTQPPTTSTQPPTSSTQPPTSSTQPPTSSTQPPTSSTQPPTSSTQPPTSSTQPPTSSTQPPTSSTQPPTSSTQPPTSSTQPVTSTFSCSGDCNWQWYPNGPGPNDGFWTIDSSNCSFGCGCISSPPGNPNDNGGQTSVVIACAGSF